MEEYGRGWGCGEDVGINGFRVAGGGEEEFGSTWSWGGTSRN